MPVPEPAAMALAALRALGAGTPPLDVRVLASSAAAAGRRLVRAGDQLVLGWDQAAEIDPRAAHVQVHELSTVPLVVLGTCIGLCWRDRSGLLFPGEPTTTAEVIRSVRRLGLAAPNQLTFVKAALDHTLPAAGLLSVRGDEIRLGPMLAAWSESQLDHLRRSAQVLPVAADG